MRRLYEPRAYGPDPIAQNYWHATAPMSRAPVAEGQITCETAIIGGGFTGLNAAIELAKAGQDVAVFEAQDFGFGASGRNGGFCCLGGETLSPAKMRQSFGQEAVTQYHRLQRSALDHVEAFLDSEGIEADRHSQGETLLAHNAKAVQKLAKAAAEFEAAHGLKAELLPKAALRDYGLHSPEFHGAMTIPLGFALHPMKYLIGLYEVAERLGVRLFGQSAIIASTPSNNTWHLRTEKSDIRARNMVLSTNGYGSENIPPWNAARVLPVQSDIILTRPMSAAEITEQGFDSDQMCYDTRHLLHYFRLLPERRFLLGLRGAISATPSAASRAKTRAITHFRRMFPAWQDVEITHHWSGFVAMTARAHPFVGPLSPLANAWGAFGYHGNGVAMASMSGKLVAQDVLGGSKADEGAGALPDFMRLTPRKFPFGNARRMLLRAAYPWMYLADL